MYISFFNQTVFPQKPHSLIILWVGASIYWEGTKFSRIFFNNRV